jgi:hypothetical protein
MRTVTISIILLTLAILTTSWRISILREGLQTHLAYQTNKGLVNTNHVMELWIGKSKFGTISNGIFYPVGGWYGDNIKVEIKN